MRRHILVVIKYLHNEIISFLSKQPAHLPIKKLFAFLVFHLNKNDRRRGIGRTEV